MTLDLETPAPCTLVQATSDPPYLGHGTVTGRWGDELSVTVDGLPATVKVGSSLVLELASMDGAIRAIVQVSSVQGEEIRVLVKRVSVPDKREYPRVEGALQVRYHVATGGESEIREWLAGAPSRAAEHAPDPFMNLSVTGLLFEDEKHCSDGDTLLVSLHVPGQPKAWRAAGHVVRVQIIPVDERDDTIAASHRVALAFTRLPDGAAEELRQHTIRIQDAWLGTPRRTEA